jgi:hypothetical protein
LVEQLVNVVFVLGAAKLDLEAELEDLRASFSLLFELRHEVEPISIED